MTAADDMRAEFMATDEGIFAFLYGLVDQVLSGRVLAPQEDDTPKVARLRKVARIYRDGASEMLERLSGLDELHAAIKKGEPMWPSQNGLSLALSQAIAFGVEVGELAAPDPALSEEEGQALVDAIERLIETDPVARGIFEQYQRLHPDTDE
jgi:hypothetical protein